GRLRRRQRGPGPDEGDLQGRDDHAEVDQLHRVFVGGPDQEEPRAGAGEHPRDVPGVQVHEGQPGGIGADHVGQARLESRRRAGRPQGLAADRARRRPHRRRGAQGHAGHAAGVGHDQEAVAARRTLHDGVHPRAPVRRIDLHCYPGTQEWITAQGPFVEALGKYWNRAWTAKTEHEVVKDFADAGVEAVLVAFDIETAVATPPCTNEYVAAMRDKYRDRIIQAWASVDPFKGEVAIRRRPRRSAISTCSASTSTRSWAASRWTIAGSTRSGRRSPGSRCR